MPNVWNITERCCPSWPSRWGMHNFIDWQEIKRDVTLSVTNAQGKKCAKSSRGIWVCFAKGTDNASLNFEVQDVSASNWFCEVTGQSPPNSIIKIPWFLRGYFEKFPNCIILIQNVISSAFIVCLMVRQGSDQNTPKDNSFFVIRKSKLLIYLMKSVHLFWHVTIMNYVSISMDFFFQIQHVLAAIQDFITTRCVEGMLTSDVTLVEFLTTDKSWQKKQVSNRIPLKFHQVRNMTSGESFVVIACLLLHVYRALKQYSLY